VSLPVKSPDASAVAIQNVIAQPGVSVNFFRSSEQGLVEAWRSDWAALPETYTVQLTAPKVVMAEGESLFLVGEGPELGAWDPRHAFGPFDATEEGFALQIELPPWTPLAGKLIVRDADDGVRWSHAPDQTFFVRTENERITLAW